MNNSFSLHLLDFKNKLFEEITEVPAALQLPYYPGLDGLRGTAIIIVIVSHLLAKFDFVKDTGAFGVEIFFVISGFLITSLLLKEKVKHGTVSFKNFYIRRILRIFPVAYLFLLVLLLINKSAGLDITNKSFVQAALYLKNIPFKGTGDWYTGHFWSLSVEEQFYVFFPFFIVNKTSRFIVIALSLILTVPLLHIVGFNNFWIFSNNIVHIITFVILILLEHGTTAILTGALFSILLFKKIIVVDKLKSNYLLSFALLIVAYLLFMKVPGFNIVYLSDILAPVIISYTIMLNLKEKNLLRYFLDNVIMIRIGVLSYSLYIWQQLFIFTPEKLKHFKYSDNIFLRVFLIFAVSASSYYFFEKFFLRYKAKFKPN